MQQTTMQFTWLIHTYIGRLEFNLARILLSYEFAEVKLTLYIEQSPFCKTAVIVIFFQGQLSDALTQHG